MAQNKSVNTEKDVYFTKQDGNFIENAGEKQSEEEYDIYSNRDIAHPNSFFGALMHMLKSSLGSGILAVPGAIAAAGIVTGIIGTLLTGLICAHAIYIMVQASLEMCKKTRRPVLSFSETATAVFETGPVKLRGWANFAGIFVDVALVTTYYAGCAVYVVFICDNIKELVNYHSSGETWTSQELMWILLVPLILFCQIRELKHLVPLSFIANTTMIVAFLITLYYMFVGISDIDLSSRILFNKIDLLPRFFSTILFAMEGIGTMLPIENSMVKAGFLGKFGVLNIGLGAVTILYTIIGLFGYLRFGDDVGPNIIAKLDKGAIPAQIARACIAAAVFFTFMLQFYVPCDITWKQLKKYVPIKFNQIAQILMRTILVILITTIAYAVPKLDAIIGIVGSVFLSTLGLMITTVIDIVRIWGAPNETFGQFHWKLWKNILILFFWLFALISGSTFAIQELIG